MNGTGISVKGRLAAGLAGAALAVALPSAGLAVGLMDGDRNVSLHDGFASFTPASADPRLARLVAERSAGKARAMRFTPAGSTGGDASRALTVAIRVDEREARAISVRSAINAAKDQVATSDGGLRIAPTRYNLGVQRGYHNFAQGQLQKPALSRSLSEANIPDLSQFEPTPGARREPSRFAARIELDEPAGAASMRSRGEQTERTIDAAASYRLTRNLDVTAGVRYEQDRNRVSALPDLEQTDSQAVYVGTQFRF